VEVVGPAVLREWFVQTAAKMADAYGARRMHVRDEPVKKAVPLER
jgi:hypothetical protein